MVPMWSGGENVTVLKLKEEVIRLAEKSPETVRNCTYADIHNKPQCIVGQAIFNLTGKIVADGEEGREGVLFDQLKACSYWKQALGVGTPEEEEAYLFVGTLQVWQDRQFSWGDALLRAQGLPVDESKYEYTDY